MATESDLKLLIAKLEARLQDLEAKDATAGAAALTPAEIAEISATAAAAAHQKVNQWWDDRTYPEISVFNPKGERKYPKAKLTRRVLWCNSPLKEDEMTPEEVDAANQLTPGVFDRHNASGTVAQGGRGYFKVRELEPGMPNGPLLVLFPFKGEQAHAILNQYRGGMLEIITTELLAKASVHA